MAHHDIWWVKGQQMHAGYWTLLLLGALVGLAQLLRSPDKSPLSGSQAGVLAVIGALAVGLGSYYVWDLYITLVKSRLRAQSITKLIRDEYGVFAPSKEPATRHLPFPIAITLLLAVAWGTSLWVLGLDALYRWALPGTVYLGLLLWKLLAWSALRDEADRQN